MAPLTIRPARESDGEAWDDLVDRSPDGTFFHRFAWARVIRQGLWQPTRYLVAERAGALEGVLPLVHKRSLVFGSSLISTAFCSYGGALAPNADVRRDLEEAAVHLGRKLGVGHVEMRNMAPQRDDWVRRDGVYATFRRPIPETEAAIIAAVSSKGRRHELKKSLRNDLSLDVGASLDRFYALLAESYRNLGSPIFPKHFFALMVRSFPGAFETYVVRGEDGDLTGSLAFYFRDDVHPLFTGGRAAARKVQANDFLYLRMMQDARSRGATIFDFGRSKYGTGSFDNKCHWGFQPQPLTYEYHLVRSADVPNLTPLNPKFQTFIRLWQRLPVGLATLAGPVLVREVG